jgi:6-phosphogluconolactonase
MKSNTPWSRRAFLQGVGYASAFSVLNKSTLGSKASLPIGPDATPLTGFAYVGSGDDAVSSEIHVFEMRGDHWKLRQSIPSRSPVSLSLHPNRQFLYVANAVDEYEKLPRATVEAYKIDARDGSLVLMNRQPLSLSGIRPRHVAVSPDGNYLVVAIHGGGAYNVLPIAPDGSVGRVSQILKEVGSGSHPVYQASAHPHSVAFDETGKHLLATDEGSDRISIFTFQNGRMARTLETLCKPVSGPGHLVKHTSGNFLYVSNTLDGSIDCYCWRADAGKMKHEQRIEMNRNTASGEAPHLVISSSGRILYAASVDEGISVWGIDSATGKLAFIQRLGLANRSLRSLILSVDNRRMFAADGKQHELLSIPVDAESGELGAAFIAAKTRSPRGLAVKYI